MEPEGILKACTTKVLMNRASRSAMRIASAYSRIVDLRLVCKVSSLNEKLLQSRDIFKIGKVLNHNPAKNKQDCRWPEFYKLTDVLLIKKALITLTSSLDWLWAGIAGGM